MTREEYVSALKALCTHNWLGLQDERKRQGRDFDPAHCDYVLAEIASAKTIGELAVLMDHEGWRRAGMMHMLVQVVVPDLPANECIAVSALR